MTTKPTLLLAAGTSEARDLAVRLIEAGYRLVLTVVSDWGETLLRESLAPFPEEDYRIHTGRLDVTGFQKLIKAEDVRLIADATHPYAQIAGETLRQVAKICDLPYLRYQREIASEEDLEDLEGAEVHLAKDSAEAASIFAELLQEDPDLICFLTIGSKDVHLFTETIPADRIIARVLPVVKSLELMEAAGIPPTGIIARQGPFSREENIADMSRYPKGVLVTKASGKRGGFAEKIAAAKALHWPVIVIRPPRDTEHLSPEAFIVEVAKALSEDKATDIPKDFLPTHVPRVIISAPRTGSGKTAVTAALLLALQKRGCRAKAFKIGADAIDPALHAAVTGDTVANLDTILYSKAANEALLRFSSKDKEITVIEGAMGLFDGLLGSDATLPEASAAKLAAQTCTPVILVVDAKSRAQGLIPELCGLQNYHPEVNIAGIILNRISPTMLQTLKPEIERICQLPVLGGLPPTEAFALPDPISDLLKDDRQEALATWEDAASQLMEHLDLQKLIQIAGSAPDLNDPEVTSNPFLRTVLDPEHHEATCGIRIAYADDVCFNKDDKENIRVLLARGFEVMRFSPLKDQALPQADLLWLGESDLVPYMEELNRNTSMVDAIHAWYKAGKPLVALGESYAWLTGRTDKKRRFGYKDQTALNDGLLLREGQTLRTREYTRIGDSENRGDFEIRRPGADTCERSGKQTDVTFLSYGRISLLSEPKLSERLKEQLR